MGMSADAILVYGVPLSEDVEFPDKEGFEDDFPEYVYMDKNCPVKLVLHCSYDYPMYIVALPGTVNEAGHGRPMMINELPELPDLPNGKIEALRNWITEHDLDDYTDGEEGWYLCSMWG